MCYYMVYYNSYKVTSTHMQTPTNKEVAALMPLKEWKLWGKALKAMPSSPRQKALLQELNELRLARGVHPITNY